MDLSEVRLFLSFDFLPISEGDANVVLGVDCEVVDEGDKNIW